MKKNISILGLLIIFSFEGFLFCMNEDSVLREASEAWEDNIGRQSGEAKIAKKNINALDNNGFAPLYYASMQGSVFKVGLLLKKGAQKELVNGSGLTALGIARLEKEACLEKARRCSFDAVRCVFAKNEYPSGMTKEEFEKDAQKYSDQAKNYDKIIELLSDSSVMLGSFDGSTTSESTLSSARSSFAGDESNCDYLPSEDSK